MSSKREVKIKIMGTFFWKAQASHSDQGKIGIFRNIPKKGLTNRIYPNKHGLKGKKEINPMLNAQKRYFRRFHIISDLICSAIPCYLLVLLVLSSNTDRFSFSFLPELTMGNCFYKTFRSVLYKEWVPVF